MLDVIAAIGGFLCGLFGAHFLIEREWQMATLCLVLLIFMEAMLIMFQ